MAKVTYDANIYIKYKRQPVPSSFLHVRRSTARAYRFINDVLIARTAKRAGVIVVTDNIDDFKKIRNFCDVIGNDF